MLVPASPPLLGHHALCVRASFSGRLQSSSGFRTHTRPREKKTASSWHCAQRPPHMFPGVFPSHWLLLEQVLDGPVCLWVSSGLRVLGKADATACQLPLTLPPPHPPSMWGNRGSGGGVGGLAQAVAAGEWRATRPPWTLRPALMS